MAKKKAVLLSRSYTYFLCTYMYIYVLNYDFFPVLTVFGPMNLFLVTALSSCWPINRSVYTFEITTAKKGSRLQDDSAVIVGPHFDFLDCSHDLKKDTPSAQLLFWHATWEGIE